MRFSVIIFYLLFLISSIFSQTNDVFTKLYSGKGLEIKFIYYSEGTGKKDNGVVILLINNNEYKLRYTFNLIFRTAEKDKLVKVEGQLNAGERKTGSKDDLFFLPFDDKSMIAEIGIRKVKIIKTE